VFLKDSKLNIDNTYLEIDNKLYSKIEPNNILKSKIELFNSELALELGLNETTFMTDEGLAFLTGNLKNEQLTYYAQAYAGHQFGHFTMLGDGRALMLGEHVTPSNNRIDIQLKGSGRTPYSRRGDGKASLSSVLREYLMSEAMYHLGIPTTRSLAVLKTNETIRRETYLDGAILVRTAKSHIRVGTFEFAYNFGGLETLQKLADYTINRHYKHLNKVEDKYIKFFHEIIINQASLIAKWQSVGFIHGVMNTDNMLVSGETIDYGPCAFMNTYNPATVFSSIDENGRYAYKNQPYIGSWNLSKLAETLLPLFSSNVNTAVDIANNELKLFEAKFKEFWYKEMSLKLGLLSTENTDKELIDEYLFILEKEGIDFTNSFRLLTENGLSLHPLIQTDMYIEWHNKWVNRVQSTSRIEDALEIMKKHNPVAIPRNNLVEEALQQVIEHHDYSKYNDLLHIISNPYDYNSKLEDKYLNAIDTPNYVTYCGT